MWIKFKDKRSDELGIIVENTPISLTPIRNVSELSIPGMDGTQSQSDDTYPNMSYPVVCRAANSSSFELISSWLTGTGDLISSRDPGKKYRARFVQRGSDSNLFKFLRTELMFSVYPFKYEAEPQPLSVTASCTRHNPGTRFALPALKVYGAGTLTIGGYELVIAATAGEDFVIIDSEIQDCYYDLNTWRNSKVTGEFPKLEPGAFDIVLGSGITRVDIDGNWRWF